jgi:hypothetical protein
VHSKRVVGRIARLAAGRVSPPRAGSGDLFAALQRWVRSDQDVAAAVLFGSSAGRSAGGGSNDRWSDYDLQIFTTNPAKLEQRDWAKILAAAGLQFQAVRPATGGTRKLTLLCERGQADLVIVPLASMQGWRRALLEGPPAPGTPDWHALNEIHVCIRTGYRILKGQKEWGAFYRRVAAEMPGVRLSDEAAAGLADISVCDALWIFQKLQRGELAAAQFTLHRSLAENNFRLVRELRLRRGEPLPSFGLARRVEFLLSKAERSWVTINARLERTAQRRATWQALEGLECLMAELVPTWRGLEQVSRLLAEFGGKRPAAGRRAKPAR